MKIQMICKRTLDATASQLIQNCSFMGTALFGNIFNVYVGKKLFEFEIANPLLILQTSNYEGVLAYIQDKRDEIKIILSELATTITMGETMDNTEFITLQWILKIYLNKNSNRLFSLSKYNIF